MERKYLIAAALLSIGLMGGIFVLVRQNGGIKIAAARIADSLGGQGSGWVQIQPRTKDGESNQEIFQDNSAISAPSGAADKAKPAPVVWCDPLSASAAEPLHEVIFNEIAWMGTAANYSDEWIELKNITAGHIDLSGWQMQNKNKKIKVFFAAADVLPADGLYLLERTDDGTVPSVAANKIYTGGMANTGDALYLFDKDCRLQDAVAASPKWPAGDNAAKLTMARLPGFNWANSVLTGGTPGK